MPAAELFPSALEMAPFISKSCKGPEPLARPPTVARNFHFVLRNGKNASNVTQALSAKFRLTQLNQQDIVLPRRNFSCLVPFHILRGKAGMLPFVLMAVLALLGFLCISHIIPSLAQRRPRSGPAQSTNNPEPRVP